MGVVQSIDRTANDPVAGGFYTVREAARLLGIGQPSKITAWLQGHHRGAAAIIKRQYKPIEGAQELGFWDLIEVRFVEHFRKQGVSLQALRKAAETARNDYGQQHPFATSNGDVTVDKPTPIGQSGGIKGYRHGSPCFERSPFPQRRSGFCFR